MEKVLKAKRVLSLSLPLSLPGPSIVYVFNKYLSEHVQQKAKVVCTKYFREHNIIIVDRLFQTGNEAFHFHFLSLSKSNLHISDSNAFGWCCAIIFPDISFFAAKFHLLVPASVIKLIGCSVPSTTKTFINLVFSCFRKYIYFSDIISKVFYQIRWATAAAAAAGEGRDGGKIDEEMRRRK